LNLSLTPTLSAYSTEVALEYVGRALGEREKVEEEVTEMKEV